MPALIETPHTIEYGRRLVPDIIDERARQDPSKPFASIPRSKSLEDGFLDVSYGALANAIHRASWWLSRAMGHAETAEVFAYLGPNDLRYPIFLCASMKCGYQMLLPSPRNSVAYQQELLRSTGCETVFCARNFIAKTMSMLDDTDVYHDVVPELVELLDPTPAAPFPYEVTFDEVRRDPFMILHTSGSTGPPKPIKFTVECTTTEDTHRLLEDPSGRLWWRLFAKNRYFLGLPCYHSAGVWFSLFIPVFFDAVVVFAPGDRPLTASIAGTIHKTARIVGGFYPPSILEEMCRTSALETVSNLSFMAYGGGPLSKTTGEKLSRLTTLHNFIGFTEASAPPRYVMKAEDWNYFEFHPASGFIPEHLHDDLYKLVFHRMDKYEGTQTAFRLFPELSQYAPGDVLSPHPFKPSLWTHRGRIDDLVVLSTGEKFNPIPAELLLKGCPVVKEALLIGEGQSYTSLLVERDPSTTAGLSVPQILQMLWPFVQKANESLATQARVMKSRVLIAPLEREFTRSPKGTVQRMPTISNFQSELASLNAGQVPASIYAETAQLKKGESLSAVQTQISAGKGKAKRLSITPISPKTASMNSRHLTGTDVPAVTSASSTALLPSESSFGKKNANIQDTINIIRNAVCSISGIPNIEDDADIFELGLDSVQAMQVVTELKEALEWRHNPNSVVLELLYAHPAIRDIATVLHSSTWLPEPANSLQPLAQSNHATQPTAKATLDAVSTPTIAQEDPIRAIESLIRKYTIAPLEGPSEHPFTVVVTGSTGSIGSHLLEHLTRDSLVSRIICLNRVEDGKHAQEVARIKHGVASPRGTKPIEYLRVDLSQPYLGLTAHEYGILQREADLIIHNAWKVDFLQSVKSFEQTHIAGVGHLVNLAASSSRRARILFISSIASVLGWHEEGPIPERIIMDPTVSGSGGYAQSKYVAERLLYEAARTSGVRATVVRLGQICGPSEACTGIWNPSDWLPQILHASQLLGAVPKSLGRGDDVDWVPIDQLPGILMELAKHDLEASSKFQVYHVANPTSVSWSSLLPAVCHRLGTQARLVSYQQWLDILRLKADQPGVAKNFPALRLLGWLQKLDGPAGARLPALGVQKSVKSSTTLSSLKPVAGTWMEHWMETWGL